MSLGGSRKAGEQYDSSYKSARSPGEAVPVPAAGDSKTLNKLNSRLLESQNTMLTGRAEMARQAIKFQKYFEKKLKRNPLKENELRAQYAEGLRVSGRVINRTYAAEMGGFFHPGEKKKLQVFKEKNAPRAPASGATTPTQPQRGQGQGK